MLRHLAWNTVRIYALLDRPLDPSGLSQLLAMPHSRCFSRLQNKSAKSHHDKTTGYSKMPVGAARHQGHCLSGADTLPGPVHVGSLSWTMRFTKRKKRSCGTKVQLPGLQDSGTHYSKNLHATRHTQEQQPEPLPPAWLVSFSVALALPDHGL